VDVIYILFSLQAALCRIWGPGQARTTVDNNNNHFFEYFCIRFNDLSRV
jgi:hypothetical protein